MLWSTRSDAGPCTGMMHYADSKSAYFDTDPAALSCLPACAVLQSIVVNKKKLTCHRYGNQLQLSLSLAPTWTQLQIGALFFLEASLRSQSVAGGY